MNGKPSELQQIVQEHPVENDAERIEAVAA